MSVVIGINEKTFKILAKDSKRKPSRSIDEKPLNSLEN